MNKLTGLLLLSAFSLTVNALPAAAADEIVTRSQVVRFGDLNLMSDDGAKTLYQRIKLAARQVCDGADDHFGNYEYRKCINKAVDEAVAKVNRPTLHALHQSRRSPQVG
jgi:UrcA family protein